MAELNNGDCVPKVIAFYLPQFHPIPENDQWWGKGFTEWTNVKKAIPQFEGHQQPVVPLHGNYYSLLSADTQKWQAQLAHQYGVFGFCYYHYWFKDGKKLLEKPAEEMLKNKEIQQPFCFSWANENWSRNWDGGNREVIVRQDYGGRKDWEMHFNYLLPFFKDERYITFDGKPVLLIYKPDEIIDIDLMCKYFRQRAKEEGFPDLYIGFQFPSYPFDLYYLDSVFDFSVGFEPVHSRYLIKKIQPVRSQAIRRIRQLAGEFPVRLYRKLVHKRKRPVATAPISKDHLDHYSFDEAWKVILETQWPNHYFPGGFTGWDNTPRNKNGVVYDGYTNEKFAEYFARLAKKAKQQDKQMIFMNAWNEWGEGAILEPDERNQFGKLEAIRDGLDRLKEDL